MFDSGVLSYRYGIHPAILMCTMAMARAYGIDGGVGLKNLGEHFGVGKKGDEVEKAEGKRRRDFTQEEWLRYGEYCKNDTMLCSGIFDKMIDQGFPEPELYVISATLKMFTEPKLIMDEPLLTQYLATEQQRKQGLLDRIERDKSLVMSNDKFAAELRALGVAPPRKVSVARTKKARLADPKAPPVMGFAFAKTDPGMQELLEHEEDEVRWLAEARVAVKSTINETRTQRYLRLGKGGAAVGVGLKWWGAHTGRWSATEKTNFQNLQRTSKKDMTKGILRKALLAPFGKKFVAADSSQIEARITGWLAGDEELTEMFARNVDIYSAIASQIYGRHIDRKKNPGDELEGQVGKVATLGLGYQQAYFKLAENFLKGALAPPIQFTMDMALQMGVDMNKWYQNEKKVERVRNDMVSRLSIEELQVHCAVSDHIVKTYRSARKPIVELWKTMEHVLEAMLEDDADYSFGPNECLRVIRHAIVLPNGLQLRYPGLAYSEEETQSMPEGFSYLAQYGKKRVHTYGGALTENCVQALARIVISEQLLHMMSLGFEPQICTHDDLAYVVPDAQAQWLSHTLKEAMKISPSWAVGLPLSVEGGWAQSYGGIDKK
jgi:DNA polymerase